MQKYENDDNEGKNDFGNVLNEYHGYIDFKDHKELITSIGSIENCDDIFEIITTDGMYVHDTSHPFDNVTCRLYKVIMKSETYLHNVTIKPQLYACSYECIIIHPNSTLDELANL